MGPLLVELVGCALVATGIVIELAYKAHIGFVAITVGSLLVAAGGVWYAKLRGPANDSCA